MSGSFADEGGRGGGRKAKARLACRLASIPPGRGVVVYVINCMIAVDTNVLIYACDQSDPRRQQLALDLVTNAEDGVLLWQVACEVISASRKLSKQGFTSTHAWNRLGEFRDLLPLVLPSDAVLVRAKELHLTRGASFWDALILAACVDSGVEILYSEDVPGFDGFEGVRGPEVARRGRSRPTWQCP